MGQSTDGILFYGYAWTGEGVDLLESHKRDEDHEPEWEEVILKARGEVDPWDSYHARGIDQLPYREQDAAFRAWKNENDGANNKALDRWYKLKQEVSKASTCDIGHHCSGDFPIPYIYIQGTQQTAYRGDAESVNVELVRDESRIDRWNWSLQAFIDVLGVSLDASDEYSEAPRGPGWLLVSYWG